MDNSSFKNWCWIATHEIGYAKDRETVSAELMAHLEDHRDALIEKGYSTEEATKTALSSMGSASEIAPQLAAIHRPFWGYLLSTSRVLLVILLCLSIIPCWKYFSDPPLGNYSYRDFDVYSAESYGGDTGRTLLHLSHPDVSFSSDDSTFTLTDAAVFTEISEVDGQERTLLYVLIEQRSLLPVQEHLEYDGDLSIGAHMHAEDSLGNYYPAYFMHHEVGDHYVVSSSAQTGIFTHAHECWINDFQGTEAEWVDICYERDGRSYVLRVDLTGGDES